MFLADLELFLVELPAGDGTVRTLLVRLVDESGREGWGETRPVWQAGELAARRNALLAVLAGRAIHDVEAILADDILADRAVASGVEMALWDLIARAAGQPLCHLLGGAYRTSVPISIQLWPGSVDAVVHWARTFAAQAIGVQTISSSGSPEGDLQLVAALREACASCAVSPRCTRNVGRTQRGPVVRGARTGKRRDGARSAARSSNRSPLIGSAARGYLWDSRPRFMRHAT